jgi:hypothetical protein
MRSTAGSTVATVTAEADENGLDRKTLRVNNFARTLRAISSG